MQKYAIKLNPSETVFFQSVKDAKNFANRSIREGARQDFVISEVTTSEAPDDIFREYTSGKLTHYREVATVWWQDCLEGSAR
jgi:hypothetical protein